MFMANNQVKVGLVGFGTVGSGVVKLLLEDADAIEAKTGLRIELAAVVDIDTTSPRPVKLPRGILTDDLNKLLNDDSIQIGVELVGGTGVAKDIQLKLLQAGKNVVTANKALLADWDTHRLGHPNRSCRQPHRRHLRYTQRNLQLYPL
jgi:homoserine dehydrogenase